MSETQHPPAFDFGVQGFKSSDKRIIGERERRVEEGKLRIEYGVPFIDDCTRGILRNDFVVLGAGTGAGKTELITATARGAAIKGRRVNVFALEAEPDEIERRIKYRELCKIAWDAYRIVKDPSDPRTPTEQDRRFAAIAVHLEYLEWRIGLIDDMNGMGDLEALADAELLKYRNLTTYYRGRDFDVDDIEKLFRAVKDQSDLLILDHIHYVDFSDDTSENAAIRKIVVRIRDVALNIGIPVVAIAHLRKDFGNKTLVPTLADFHGTSEITKRATVAILLAPATDAPSADPLQANTYITVAKHRARGVTGIVARHAFHIPTRSYSKTYELGRLSFKGDEFVPLEQKQIPRWAKHARVGGIHQ